MAQFAVMLSLRSHLECFCIASLVLGVRTGQAREADPSSDSIEITVPAKITTAANLAVRGGEISEIQSTREQAEGSSFIAIEAEDLWDVFWQAVDQGHTNSEDIMEAIEESGGRGVVGDADASKEKAVERFSDGQWIVRIREPGDYTIWHRLWIPTGGSWNYSFQVARVSDGEFGVQVKAEPQQWTWQKIGTVRIDKAGAFRLIARDFLNGKRLDKIVLHRDAAWQPDGKGPEDSPLSSIAKTGTLTFEPPDPYVPVQWESVTIPGIERSPEARLQVRWSEDREWEALGIDGKLRDPGSGSIPQVRLTVARSEGKFPVLGVPSFIYRAAGTDLPQVVTKIGRFTFNAATGGLNGIELKGEPGDFSLVPPGSNTSPFRVFLKPDNNSSKGGIWLEAGDFEVTRRTMTPDKVSFEYRGKEHAVQVRTEYSVHAEGYLQTNISVGNDAREDVLQVEFPRVVNARGGKSSADDTLIWPDSTGKKYPEPSVLSGLVTEYPRCTMPWFALYDKTGGLYLGSHDPGLVSLELRMEPDESRSWITFLMTKRDQIKAGGGSAEYGFGIGAFPGSWHSAAPWYRNWFQTRFPKAKWPEWLDETDAWLMGNIKGYPSYETVKEIEFARALCLGLQHVQLWATDTFNSTPLYYLPPPRSGGSEEFSRINKWWKDKGGKVGYYVLPQGPATYCFNQQSTEYFGTPWAEIPEWGRPPGKLQGKSWDWLVRNARYEHPDRRPPKPDEKVWKRELAVASKQGTGNYPFQYTAMSNYSPEWTKWFTDWVLRYVKDFHTATVYLDTFHTQAQTPDYNPWLGLHGAGRGGYYRSELAKAIFEEGRRIDSYWLPIMEMQCDAYNPWMASQAGASSIDSEFTRFTHPDFLFFEGQTGRGWGPKRFKRFNSSWMYGNRLDHREYEGWATEMIKMRSWITRWINSARFLDDLGLSTSNPELRGKLHRVDEADGSRGFLAMFWNTARREHLPDNATLTGRAWESYKVSIDLGPMSSVDGLNTKPEDWIPRRAILIDMGEEPRDLAFDVVTKEGRPHVEFEVPPRQVNGVLFIREAVGARSVLCRWDQKDFRQMDVHILNPGSNPVSGIARVAKSEVAFDKTELAYTVEPGERKVLSFPYQGGKPPEFPEVVNLTVTMNGAERRLFAGAFPFMDNASFEIPTGVPTTNSAAFAGNRSAVIEKPTRLRLRLEADTKYRLSFQARSAEGPAAGLAAFDEVTSKQAMVDGKAIRFDVKFDVGDQEWKPVSFTLQTPHIYHDATLLIRRASGKGILIDQFEIEKLPEDAEVEHRPDVMMQAEAH